jgi:DNA-binding GntR family transcriptional regulator
MANNALLTTMLDPLQARLHWLLRQHDDPTVLCREHRELYEAIAAGRVEDAGRLAAQHVHTSRDLATALLFSDNINGAT